MTRVGRDSGWKGLLPSLLPKVGQASLLKALSSWVLDRMETAQPLWATCSTA